MEQQRFEVMESPVSKGERMIIEHMGEDMINRPVTVYGNPELAEQICVFMNSRTPRRTDIYELKWTDDSSYSRGQRGNVEPTVLSSKIDGLRIVIHRHVYNPDKWHVSCKDIGIDTQILQPLSLEDAKAEGLKIVSERLEEKINTFLKVRDSIDCHRGI